MDFLQIALILLIVILGIFLSLTGLQVFLILKNLKKTLDGINWILFSGDEKVIEKVKQAAKKPSARRFFKR